MFMEKRSRFKKMLTDGKKVITIALVSSWLNELKKQQCAFICQKSCYMDIG